MSNTASTGIRGQPPTVKIGKAPKLTEVEKYERCWDEPDYRKFSPGEHLVQTFWEAANPLPTQTLVDWGCGSGRAGLALHKRGLDVTLVDFAENALDEAVRAATEDEDGPTFIRHDLTEEIALPSMYGFCTDVMEHLPPEQVDAALDTILNNSRHCFFQICCTEDSFGHHKGIRGDKEKEHLHLSVHDYQWWLEKFVEKKVIIHRSMDLNTSCIFYVTGFGSLNLSGLAGEVNVSEDEIIENIRHAATLNLPSMRPCESQDVDVLVLAGGPSLADFTDEIIEKREAGAKVVTINGSYRWAIAHGIKPSLQCVIDSRDFNHRFTEQFEGMTDDTRFIISSSAHPKVFDDLPRDRTWLWHVSLSDTIVPVIEECFGTIYEDWFPAPGGSTCTLRALAALRMLGFHRFIVYGLDNCIYPDGTHHAYEQKENDKDVARSTNITVAGGTSMERTFRCAPWMIFQAQDFMAMVPRLLKDAELIVKGDGMIAHIIKASAELGGKAEISK